MTAERAQRRDTLLPDRYINDLKSYFYTKLLCTMQLSPINYILYNVTFHTNVITPNNVENTMKT